MRCDSGRLRAYLDNALEPTEQAAVSAHLAACPACRRELAALSARASFAAARLTILEPTPAETPAGREALARFHAAGQNVAPDAIRRYNPLNLGAALARSLVMIKESLLHGRLRPVAIAAAAVASLLILFSFAPVQRAAADFLGIFRVRKFAVIPLDPAQQQKLEALAQQADDGRFGRPTMLREPGRPQPVADLAAASTRAGFAVRAPAALPAGATAQSLTVQSGPALRYEMDRTIMAALLAATQAQDVKLPDVDRLTLEVDVPFIVTQEYAIGAGRLTIMQMSSPQVKIPPGVDLAAIGEAGFKFLGMPDADARRLAQSIDWTSTLVIPIPTDVVQYREVTVDGVPGLLVEHRAGATGRRDVSLLWQKDGILYGIESHDVGPLVTMQVADSLR